MAIDALLFLTVPITASLAIVSKIPEPVKKIIFSHKTTCLLAATLISFAVVPHIVTGVMAGYGILICDLVLYPSLLLMRRLWLRKVNKVRSQAGKPPLKIVQGGKLVDEEKSKAA